MKKLIAILSVTFICVTSFTDSDNGMFAVIKTEKGEIHVRLEHKKTPMTVANFIGLSEGKIENSYKPLGVPFYDGLTFHRVEPGAIIQGGCPLGNGLGNPGYKFNNEIDKTLKHDKEGVLAMANSGKNTNGSQFYITMKPIPQLDKKYTVFGYVEKGMNVVKNIEVGDKIEHIEIMKKGDEAALFNINTNFPEKARKKI